MLSLLRTLVALVLFACFATAPPAFAADANATEVQGVITSQIEAFRHDDGAKAFSFAAPELHLVFPNSDVFMGMVRQGYAAVYNPQQFQFGPFAVEGAFFKQQVEITASDGTGWTALYTLSRQSDGTLKINGCQLVKRPGVGA
jgi:Domain of unknown function (DUF4864)